MSHRSFLRIMTVATGVTLAGTTVAAQQPQAVKQKPPH